jgi:CO/xanthine dehydrogenase Mo-binding subunit
MAILGALAVLRRNAVFPAMGRRVRDLSITPAKLLRPE